MLPKTSHIVSPGWADYALIDSGHGRKIERFGRFRLSRPEPMAIWKPTLAQRVWDDVDASFDSRAEGEEERAGEWRQNRRLPAQWPVPYRGVTLLCRPTPFGHVGLFAEQAPHWDWMIDRLGRRRSGRPKLLNLFGYTGAASLLAAGAGAEVTHVDASKRAIAWARENQAASGLEAAPIRWICEDAVKFVGRELRRGSLYSAILLDPPRFGRGPGNEVWRIEQLGELLGNLARLLEGDEAFIVLTVYAVRLSHLGLHRLASQALAQVPGRIEVGELLVQEENSTRLMPTSHFVRWSREARA